jgi:hypothetical protein
MVQLSRILAIVLFGVTAGIADAAGLPPLHATGALPTPTCDPSSAVCAATVNVGDLTFVDGDGNVASILHGFSFSFVRLQSSPNPVTEVLVNFSIENKTVDRDVNEDHMHIRFRDSFGNYLPDIVSVALARAFNKCGVNPNPQALTAPVSDIYAHGATTYEITQEKITEALLVC